MRQAMRQTIRHQRRDGWKRNFSLRACAGVQVKRKEVSDRKVGAHGRVRSPAGLSSLRPRQLHRESKGGQLQAQRTEYGLEQIASRGNRWADFCPSGGIASRADT